MTTLMICTLVLISCIKGKEVKHLLGRLKNVNWHGKINALIQRLYPWALKAGRRSARPILQFYYVLADEKTSTLDRALIYAAIAYTILDEQVEQQCIFKYLDVIALQHLRDSKLRYPTARSIATGVQDTALMMSALKA